MKILVLEPTTYLGRNLISRLSSSSAEQPHEILTPSFDVLDESNLGQITNLLQNNPPEAIIIDINQPDRANELTSLISTLKDYTYPTATILCAVSTVQTWNETLKSSKKALNEAQYKARKCSARYKPVRVLESLILSTTKDNLQPFVVAAGLLYGAGEHELANLFRLAWLNEGNNVSLPVLSDEKDQGKNLLPTIHVYDLVSVIRLTLENFSPDNLYLVAVDNSQTSQLQLIQAIATGLNSGSVRFISPSDPSIVFTSSNLLSPQQFLSDLRFDTDFLSNLPLEWHCEGGFPDNFDTIRAEFTAKNNLNPLRIMLYGPPAAGKTFWAQKLAKIYNLPIISVRKAIEEAKDAKQELAELINKEFAVQQANLTQKKPKKGTNGPQNPAKPSKISGNQGKSALSKTNKGGLEQFNPESARLSPYLLSKIMKSAVRSFEQRNKGFILDNFPRTAEEAQFFFYSDCEEDENGEPVLPAAPERDENGQEIDPAARDPSTSIENIVVLEGEMAEMAGRSKKLEGNAVILGHNDAEGFKRRWNRWEFIENKAAPEIISPLAMLTSQEILYLPQSLAENPEKALETVQLYIEKKGKPYNYHPTPEEIATKDEAQRAEIERAATLAQEAQESKEIEEKQLKLASELSANSRRAAVLLEHNAILEAAAQPLRGYLMENVIPAVVEGLLDVVKQKPVDPVDFLAEYLFKVALGADPKQPIPSQ
jgi:adenylate kinase